MQTQFVNFMIKQTIELNFKDFLNYYLYTEIAFVILFSRYTVSLGIKR